MLKRIHAVIFVLLAAGLLLTACERSASVSPLTTATTSAEIPFPVATQSQIMKDILAATQTASVVNGTLAVGSLPGMTTSTAAFTYITATPQPSDAATEVTEATGTLAATATASLPTSTPTIAPTDTPYPTITPGAPTQFASCSGIPGYGGGVPTLTVVDVEQDQQVTIDGANFPAGQTLIVRMGPYGTEAAGGTQVGTLDSGPSGCFSAAFAIPASLAGSPQIAIRVETDGGYYFGYNWFYNTSTH